MSRWALQRLAMSCPAMAGTARHAGVGHGSFSEARLGWARYTTPALDGGSTNTAHRTAPPGQQGERGYGLPGAALTPAPPFPLHHPLGGHPAPPPESPPPTLDTLPSRAYDLKPSMVYFMQLCASSGLTHFTPLPSASGRAQPRHPGTNRQPSLPFLRCPRSTATE